MSKWAALSVPQIDSLEVTVVQPKVVRLVGKITMQEPSVALGGFIKAVHAAALSDGLNVVELDVTALKFVNSSAIRVFLDWASLIKSAGTSAYKLRIVTTRKFTWQKTSFVAITALAAGNVEVAQAD